MNKRFSLQNVLVFFFVIISLLTIPQIFLDSSIDFYTPNQLQDPNTKAVFIYNTTLDSDNGLWCNDLAKSWYEEVGRFPKVAFLILTNSGLDIIDVNAKSVWMQFFEGVNHLLPNADFTSVSAKNGKVLLGSDSGLLIIDFKTDSTRWYSGNTVYFTNIKISGRNSSIIWYKKSSPPINRNNIYDAAVTNIGDTEYVAAATERGVVVINLATEDVHHSLGTIAKVNTVSWGDNDLYYGDNSGLYARYNIETLNSNWSIPDITYNTNSSPNIIGNIVNDIAVRPGSSTSSIGENTVYVATNSGVTELQENKTLPILSKITHWAETNAEADYEILSDNNISSIATDGASLWLGNTSGVDEIRLAKKSSLYKNYTVFSSPSIINNNVTTLSGNGLVLVGTLNGVTLLDDLWWDSPGYKYRQQLLIPAYTEDINEGYSVPFTFNHAGLVDRGRALASGNDIRVVSYDGIKFIELDRVLDSGSRWNTNATTVWFKINSDIPQGYADNRYYLYYGKSNPGIPPADKNKVFYIWEDFEGGLIGMPPNGWTNDAAGEFVVVDSISKRLRKGRYVNSENDITIDNTIDLDNFELQVLLRKVTDNTNGTNRFGILFHSDNSGYRISIGADSTINLMDSGFKPVTANVNNFSFQDDTDYKLKLQVYDSNIKAYWNNLEILRAGITSGRGKIGFFNDNSYSIGGPEIDNLVIRRYIEPEPAVLSNSIEMANLPIGDIISAEETKKGYVNIIFIADSPYDQRLKAGLEWSTSPTTGFQSCYVRDVSGVASTNGLIINNLSQYQIDGIRTSTGPNIVNVEWVPPASNGFPLNTMGTYWLRLTVSNDSSNQEVPDIVSLTVDTRGMSAVSPGQITSGQSASSPPANSQILQQQIVNVLSYLGSGVGEALTGYIQQIQDTVEEIITDYFKKKSLRLVFITPPQTINVNTLSDVITIQVQDINGDPADVTENIVIELSSSSRGYYE